MARRSFTQSMPTGMSASRPAGACFSCAFSNHYAFNFIAVILDTMIMVSIFVIASLGVLPGGLVSIPAILLICLAIVLCGSLIKPKEQP